VNHPAGKWLGRLQEALAITGKTRTEIVFGINNCRSYKTPPGTSLQASRQPSRHRLWFIWQRQAEHAAGGRDEYYGDGGIEGDVGGSKGTLVGRSLPATHPSGIVVSTTCVPEAPSGSVAMPRLAFKMHLFPGHAAEYQRRHDELWPELKQLLTASGVSDYSIFLDEETSILIGVLKVEDPAVLDELPKHPVMQRW